MYIHGILGDPVLVYVFIGTIVSKIYCRNKYSHYDKVGNFPGGFSKLKNKQSNHSNSEPETPYEL